MTPPEASVLDVPSQAIKDEAVSWPDKAKAALITDHESYHGVAEFLLGIKALRKKIAETFDPHIKRAFEAHRALTKEKADAETPLTDAETLIKGRLAAWDTEQERLRLEAQRVADEKARQSEEDDRLARAAAMEIEGQQFGDEQMVAEAHELITQPAPVIVAPPVARATPKVSGISYRTVVKFRIVNPDLVPRQYCAPVEAKIRGIVTALGMNANIPGVQTYTERVVAAGGGR